MERAIQIAQDLLKIRAVFFRPEEPFTWASGIKSPVYCDNRLTLSDPDVRTDVETGLAERIRTQYPAAEVLMGTSTAGIAHAAITAHRLGLPMGYGSSRNSARSGRRRAGDCIDFHIWNAKRDRPIGRRARSQRQPDGL